MKQLLDDETSRLSHGGAPYQTLGILMAIVEPNQSRESLTFSSSPVHLNRQFTQARAEARRGVIRCDEEGQVQGTAQGVGAV